MNENTESSAIDKLRNWMRTSITLKLLGIGIIILLLLIPLSFVHDLVRERSYRLDDAKREVSDKWGRQQTIEGLILTVPFTHVFKYEIPNKEGEFEIVKKSSKMNFYPEKLNIEGEILPEIRKRGIFEIPVYETDMSLSGEFAQPDFSSVETDKIEIDWENAYVTMLLSDLRNFDGMTVLWNGVSHDLEPYTEYNGPSGVKALVPVNLENVGDKYSFDIDMKFKGSEGLYFAPLGKETHVKVASTWPDPSFQGAFLPENHTISKDGFEADWTVLFLNRPLAQYFESPSVRQSTANSGFGVDLFMSVDNYAQTERSAKYAVLLIALTFALFFFIQMLQKIQIHPVQFLLVGLALSVFYTLLLAISEHLAFSISYLIAGTAVVLLITGYMGAAFKKRRLTILTFSVLSALYVYVYSILQLEDFALLVGSIGLFTALALLMYVSRNMDWYTLKKKEAVGIS